MAVEVTDRTYPIETYKSFPIIEIHGHNRARACYTTIRWDGDDLVISDFPLQKDGGSRGKAEIRIEKENWIEIEELIKKGEFI